MEFLKGLQEALAMGLTKEQYIDVWKTDKTAQGLSFNNDSLLTAAPQNKENAKATLVDNNADSSVLDLKQLKENNDHFLSSFKHMCDQLKEKQEQSWQQFQHKQDQMVEEVRSRFNLLSDHISNVADCNTNSLKVYLMQELGLFQQELRQMIQEGTVKHETDPDQSNISRKVQDNASISECRSDAASNKDSVEINGQKRYSKTQEMLGTLLNQESAAELNVYQQHNIQNGIPNYEDRLTNGAQHSTPLMDVMKFISAKADSNMSEADVSENNHNALLVIPGNKTKHAQYLDRGSVESKLQYTKSIESQMPYAQSLESQMSYAQAAKSHKKQSSTGDKFLADSRALSGSSASLNSVKDNVDTHTLSVSEMPSGSQVFRVKASEPNVIFLSPAMISYGVPVQAKFRGSFDAEGRLNISLHVRTSGYNGKWPLILSGEGTVYHFASKHFSPLWQLLPTTLHETDLVNMECAFRCEVCLTTGRGKYPDVTYNQLVLSRFIEDDILTINCTVNASTELLSLTNSL